jgi:hypothetical protein
VKNVSQTQTQNQTQTQTPSKIQVLKDLKKALPMDVWKFAELVEKATNCEFRYDENAEPTKRVKIAENIIANIYEKEFNMLVCEDEDIDVVFKNAIYTDDYENNNIVLLYYEDVDVTSN